MADSTSLRRRRAEEDTCPLESKSARTEREARVLSWTMKAIPEDGPEEGTWPESGVWITAEEGVAMETYNSSEDDLGRLDIDLDRKSKQHNLTSSNVRTILHEVITHEHVVAMMKAAIRDTQDLPMFEPKMTRARVKQAVQQGQSLNWSLTAEKTTTFTPPQFVDIDLEEDEDSSDEEYCPDEEEEDDTAEDMFLSDTDSFASPLRMQCSQARLLADHEHPQHLLTGSSFLEKLNAVEEELDCSSAFGYDQCLDGKAAAADDGGGGEEDFSCLAYRTRSKLPLVNVPLGQLEAELLAPDITADMYDQRTAHQKEDRHWTRWLLGLVAPDTEAEDAEDDDDPEYNILDDLDEPDLEDYRTDRAVQITKKEVNELLEELFDTLQEKELVKPEEEEEQQQASSQTGPKFNVPKALRFEEPLANMLTERRRTVRKQYEALQQRRALQDTTNHPSDNVDLKDSPCHQPKSGTSILVLPGRVYPALRLNYTQKLQLQQQIQQHVQLLTQVHLLSLHVNVLNHEACITKHYLEELQRFAGRQEQLSLRSCFRVCNLQGALDLLQEVGQRGEPHAAPAVPAASRRWLPTMTPTTSSHAFPLLPPDTAWLFATRPVFLYPELLPVCNLDPTLHTRHRRSVYTAGEDWLIVLGLKHFEGSVQLDQLITSHLLCKTRWSFRKRVREMSSSRAPGNVIKTFLAQGVAPPPGTGLQQSPPRRSTSPGGQRDVRQPNWLKNSQQIIQRTRLDTSPPRYPPLRPRGCTLRLHPNWLNKSSRPLHSPQKRLFTLAHNASLLPLCPAERQVDTQTERQVDSQLANLPGPGVTSFSGTPTLSGVLRLTPPAARTTFPTATVHSIPAHQVCADIIQTCPPVPHLEQHTVSRQQEMSALPFLTDTTNPIMPCAAAALSPGFVLLQMAWTPTATSQHEEQEGEEKNFNRSCSHANAGELVEGAGDEASSSASTLSPISSGVEEEEETWTSMDPDWLNGRGEDRERREAGGGEQGERREAGGGEQGERREAGGGEQGERREAGGGEGGGAGRQEGGWRRRGRRTGGRKEGSGGGERDEDRDKDRDGEEEEEDFDDLTQDEDEEEVMSSASEESVLSVPELQETMKQLTWLASERRLCADGDSEEDHSPTSPGSQEEEEEEEEGPKGEESGDHRSNKVEGDETPSCEGTPRGGGRCPVRGRGRSRPHRGLRKSRQERHSKDAAKLSLLYDEKLLDSDPHRESKDVAFAQSYLSRVREVLHDVPEKMEEFVSLLNEFEQIGEGQEVVFMFRKLRCLLENRTDLLRDFAAFLHPEQALQCGLFEEQQAFEHSRRFLRQLEISFGDNPSHYQKIIKALQAAPDLSPCSILELKAQMAALLKGHNHLQAEFWVFFDELRPPPARLGQFEEAHWPDEGGGGSDGGEGIGSGSGGGASCGFEEVTLPDLEEEEEVQKIQPMTSRRQRRKMDAHRSYKDCDWSHKDWRCLCHDVKISRHRRKGCSRCHGNKSSGSGSRTMKSLDPLYAQISSALGEPADKDLELKVDDTDQSTALWDVSFPLTDEKDEEEDELEDDEDDEDEEERRSLSPALKRSKRVEAPHSASTPPSNTCSPIARPPSTSTTCSPSPTSVCLTSTSTSTCPPPSIISYPPSISSTCPPSTSTSTCSDFPIPCPPSTPSSVPVLPAAPCALPRPSAPPELPVCAKNISMTASGEKVILWTREADRVILTTCQQEGANQNTFQAVSNLLGNKTPNEVSRRFRDLMRLFRTAARQASSEDEVPPPEMAANEEQD
ncbi:LOW QUALITY PROTEIN: GON-4-like protein [Aulostomus maculatus]